jgi:hypothetical protein
MTGASFRLIAPLCLPLISCESPEKKYERLQSEIYSAEAPLRIADDAAAEGQSQCPELTNLPTNAYLDACTARLAKARTKAVLHREMNQFMNGR